MFTDIFSQLEFLIKLVQVTGVYVVNVYDHCRY